MKEENKPSYYAVIPANVRYSDIPPNAKLLYGEITALCDKTGFCWSTNKYFADLYKKSESTISVWISHLIRCGFIESEIEDNFRRKIFLKGVLEKSKGGIRKTRKGVLEKSKESNTISITSNNTYNKEHFAPKVASLSSEKTFEELEAKAKKITATQSDVMPDGDEELTLLKSEKPKRKKVAPSTNGFVLIQLTNIEIEKHMEITLSRLPEANIQAEFYHICKKNAVNCILEYTYNGSRFDALVYDDKRRAVVIVEFKSYKTDKHPKTKTKQLKKYQQFGLPIVLVTRIEDVEWAFKECLKHIPIKEVAKAEPKEPSLFTMAKDSFTEWHKKHSPGVELYWDRKEIGQLAQMIKRLQHEAKSSNFVARSDQDFIEKIFDPFCKKYINSKEWFSDSFTPASIVSKWNVIVQALRNPKTKAPSIQKIDNTKYDKYIKAAQDGTLTKAFTK